MAALLFHPIMGAFGVSLCLMYFGVCKGLGALPALDTAPSLKTLVVPGSWLFAPATPSWRTALRQHSYYTLQGWHWYELLGAVAPPALLFFLARLGHKRCNAKYVQLAATLVVYSTLQFAIASLMLLPSSFQRLASLQPMRYLHLTFLLMALLAGAALAEYVLVDRVWLWLLIFVPLAAVNGYAQRLRYPSTQNLELPWSAPKRDWLKAFVWIRANTPKNAIFALDPEYLALAGEDNHSFRALAERSSLVDARKDAAVVTQVPKLGDIWQSQHDEQIGWETWTATGFSQLAATTPVRWIVVSPAQGRNLQCPYRNTSVSVCKLSGGGAGHERPALASSAPSH